MINEISKVIDLNIKKEERVLDFSDFQKQEIKFDIAKLQEAYHQIVKIKKFEDAGVTHFCLRFIGDHNLNIPLAIAVRERLNI